MMDKNERSIRAIAVFCGSKNGAAPIYAEQAAQVGQLMAAHGITMIYGGGRNGLMGCVANACMDGGGTVRGVIPTRLIEWETQHTGLTELTVVDDMHQRKRLLYELCDAVLILPGGFGTLDELFETLTWNQLSLHNKQVFILNSGGFYNYLLAHLQQLRSEGFLYEDLYEGLTVLQSPNELLMHLQ